MLLKRRTTQNIVWGGLAGCFPALIGWTAVTGELAWAPVVLFAGRLLLDAAAHLGPGPALPRGLRRRRRPDAAGGREGAEVVGRQIVAYSWVMVATSLLLWPVADTGWVYPVVAAVLGAVFLVQAHRMWSRTRGTEDLSVIRPMVLFHASNLYLSLLFVAVALDPLLTR